MINQNAGQPDRQWCPPEGSHYGMPLTGRGGWKLYPRHNTGNRQWNLISPGGDETTFSADGGLYLAIDMANLHIDEKEWQ